MKKALLIYNPHSGHREAVDRLDYIVKRFMERNILICPFRLDKNNKRLLTGLLKIENYEFAVVSGGDGTISTTVDTFLNSFVSLPLGIMPAGTCNDLAHALSLPGKLEDCIDVILEGNTVKIDTGLINNTKYFINSLAVGTFAEISYSTSSTMKKSIGSFAYYMNALRESLVV